MDDCNAKIDSPSTDKSVGIDRGGELYDEDWDYASVIGMLMYLAHNSRPDIAYAVHQAARFTHDPKKSHAVAIKQILRYL
mmetsp:Transcript_35250/g.50024  ORF Transcript_35250/g.50024 Transcript_35250/m.50024 type:complete len:80 (-) Transcript_35250:510-749(-)